MSRPRLKVGDVFTVPIDEGRLGVGQIVGTYGTDAYYFAIFDAVTSWPASIDLGQVLNTKVIYLALWKVISSGRAGAGWSR